MGILFRLHDRIFFVNLLVFVKHGLVGNEFISAIAELATEAVDDGRAELPRRRFVHGLLLIQLHYVWW